MLSTDVRGRWPALLLAAGLTFAGCSAAGCSAQNAAPSAPTVALGSSTSTGVADAVRARAIDALFAARTSAVAHHDRAAFSATVDPGSASFVTSQQTLYADLTALPLESYAISAGTVDYPAKARPDGLPVYVEQVHVSYRLAGWDRAPITRTYAWTLVRRGGVWRLASTSDVAAVPAAADPWDLGPVTVTVAGTVLLVTSGLTAAQLTGLTILTTAAVATDRRVLVSWDGRVIVYAGRDTTLFDALFRGGGHGADSYAGATISELVDGSATALAGTRVLVSPDAASFTDTSPLSREALVLRHEFAHVALAPEVGPARPLWLTEGTAEWVSYAPYPLTSGHVLGIRRAMLGSAAPPHVPTDADFAAGGQTALNNAYTDAWLVCQDVVDHGGPQRLFTLYAAVSALPAGTNAKGVDAVVRRVLGMSTAQLQAQYLADLRAA